MAGALAAPGGAQRAKEGKGVETTDVRYAAGLRREEASSRLRRSGASAQTQGRARGWLLLGVEVGAR